MKKKYPVNINKLVTVIVRDMRMHGYKCDADVTCFPVYEDKLTGKCTTIPTPRLSGVDIGCTPTKAVKIMSEYKNFILYDLYSIYWTTHELPRPYIMAGFSTGWEHRLVIFEQGSYNIIRNDFVTILARKLQDMKDKKYQYERRY